MTETCPFAELNDTFAKIGLLICNFANFEGHLAPTLAMMLNDNGEQASAILGQVDSFAYKWGVVVGIAGAVKDRHEIARAVLEIEAGIRTANGFRNKLAHGGTRIADGKFWLIENANTTKRGEPKGRHLTRQEIFDHNELILRAMEKLSPLIDRSKLTSKQGLMRALHDTTGASNDSQRLNVSQGNH